MSCIKKVDDFKDFVLVHKIWKKNFKGLKEDDFVMKGRVTIPNSAWRPPLYFKHWLTEDSRPSKNKQIYFSLLSKNIKYDEDFARDNYLIFLDPKILKDYSDKVHITPQWAFGMKLLDTMYYDNNKTLLQNLKRFNKGIIKAIGKDNDMLFMNEVVIEADELDIKSYIIDIDFIE